MRKIVYCAVVFFILPTSAINASEIRSWTVGKEHIEIEAEFVRISDDAKSVSLRQKNGREISVELGNLSRADQLFVATQKIAPGQRPRQNGQNPGETPQAPPPSKPEMPKQINNRQDFTDAILSKIDDADDRKTVLDWFRTCDGTEWNVLEKTIIYYQKPPAGFAASPVSFIAPQMKICLFENANTLQGGVYISTCGTNRVLQSSPGEIRIVDDSGQVWRREIGRGEWSWKMNYNNNRWRHEAKFYGFTRDITERDADILIEAIIKNDRCVIQINGEGQRNIPISASKAREFKLFSDAYKVLKKYFREIE
jgi:hypothetical protein